MKRLNPATIAGPFGAYAHGVEIPANARQLHVSGQVGVRPDGGVGDTVAEQSKTVWENIRAILAEAGMDMGDIVKMTAYLIDPADLPDYAAARNAALGDARPASTLLFVPVLLKPDWKVEVELIAARVE